MVRIAIVVARALVRERGDAVVGAIERTGVFRGPDGEGAVGRGGRSDALGRPLVAGRDAHHQPGAYGSVHQGGPGARAGTAAPRALGPAERHGDAGNPLPE